MPPDSSSDVKFEVRHVLFIDIVGYSELLIHEQSQRLEKLKQIVRGTEQFRLAEAAGKLIRLPTGDGGALVFRSSPEAPVLCALEVSKALKSHPELQVRMGIHSGPVNEVTDLNEQANIAGAGINLAQRVMDCGDAGHILLSKHVAEDLKHYARWRPCLHPLGDCEVKHGVIVSVVNLHTDEAGNPQTPQKFGGEASRQKAAVLERRALRKSIAVLPFENLSEDKANAYFADGIQEELLTRLSKIADLKVISRTSTQRFKSSPENLPQIAKQLGVAHVLEGGVQKAGDQVRVHVQLIDAENDSHLWAERYDRKLTDIFAVETDIATKIADALQAKLTGAERRAISSQPTKNDEAHQLYLKGLYYWYKHPAPDFARSRDCFQQAVDLDPTYAPGYGGLSYYYGFASAIGMAPPEDYSPKSEAAAKKALELDDTLPDAYNSLAAIQLYYRRDWLSAESYFRRGIDLNPNSAEIHHHYALCLTLFGRKEETLVQMERSAELDPLARRNNLDRGTMLFFLRLFDRAIEQFRKTLELYPDFAAAHESLGYAYQQIGLEKEAITKWSKAFTLTNRAATASEIESAYAKLGFAAALRVLAQKQLQQLDEKRNHGEYVSAAEYVKVYVRLGDKEQALAAVEKAVKERNRPALETKSDPQLDLLRGERRFHERVNEIMQPDGKRN